MTLPDPGRELRDYESTFTQIGPARTLTAAYVEQCGERLCVVDDQAFLDFVEDANANTTALQAAIEAYTEKHFEGLSVLAAGQQAEIQAQICHDMSKGLTGALQQAAWPAAAVLASLFLLAAL